MESGLDLNEWAEIHYLVVERITKIREGILGGGNNLVKLTYEGKGNSESSGDGALWELSQDLTNKFYNLHKDETWENGEFLDTFNTFMGEQLK